MAQSRPNLETLHKAVSGAAQRLASALAAERGPGSRPRANGSKGLAGRLPAARKFVEQTAKEYVVALRRYREAMETRFIDR